MSPNLTVHFLQVLWMTDAALFHLLTCFLTSQDRTAAGSITHIQHQTKTCIPQISTV